jgi:hypothetical protein
VTLQPLTSSVSTYAELIDSMGFDAVLAEVSTDDYQGDTYSLAIQGSRIGLVVFGWGSCSGCDALDAAHGNLAELTQVRDDIYKGVHWFDSYQSLADWLNDKTKDGNRWYATDETFLRFRALVEASAININIALVTPDDEIQAIKSILKESL